VAARELIVKRVIAAALCAFAALAIAEERVSCVRNPGDHYDEGVAFHLARKGVAHRLSADQGVCVAGPLAAELDLAMKEVDRYFWKVDRQLDNPCEERALVEWGAREGLRFDVSSQVDLKGNIAGRVFRLRSYTQEEVAANRRKLEEAPRGVSCRPATVASLGNVVIAQAPAPYPNKPIKLILPFPPGGGTDILGRVIAERLGANLGQTVVVENRGGAGGNVGAEAAAKSPPDGYTIVLVAPSLAISPSLYAKLNYDPIKDLAPITLVGVVPNVIITDPALPAQNLAEFIALAKSKPGAMNFGSGGNGTSNHLAGELFNTKAGVKLVHVPYKGVNLAMNEVLAGRIQLVVIGIPAALPFIQAGRLRALGVIAPQRSPALPNVPTVVEAGLSNYDVTTWYGILAPAGTPRPIIDRLNAELVKIMHAPDLQEKLAATGTEPRTSTPEEFGEYLRQEMAKWREVVREAGLKAE
jgi:tripartite-type tricarboxylate transporter receptor subunit TctC